MFSRSFDEQSNTVVVLATGVWTRAEVDEHYVELARMIEQVRIADEPVRILLDLTDCPRQSAEIEDYVFANAGRTVRVGDRAAILVGDEHKHFLRAAMASADAAIFSTRLAAEQWLYMPDLKKPH